MRSWKNNEKQRNEKRELQKTCKLAPKVKFSTWYSDWSWCKWGKVEIIIIVVHILIQSLEVLWRCRRRSLNIIFFFRAERTSRRRRLRMGRGEAKSAEWKERKNSNQLISAPFYLLFPLFLLTPPSSTARRVYISLSSCSPFCLLKLKLRQLSILLPSSVVIGPKEHTFFRTRKKRPKETHKLRELWGLARPCEKYFAFE